jgi:hypothetical protein
MPHTTARIPCVYYQLFTAVSSSVLSVFSEIKHYTGCCSQLNHLTLPLDEAGA